ncbi:MAG: isopenicillin N synthase family oxygenase [Acidimicrobiales bacterium]|nr:MAG: isopenicillin N synthase family oxygenase [Acidimicrobiales bacterium]
MIPTVDLTASTAAEELADAFEQLGFVQVVGHHLNARASNRLRAACDTFFAAPEEAKRRYVHPDPMANRGYRAKGAEALSYSLGEASPPDLFESFNCGPGARVTDSPLQQRTPWPNTIAPDFHGAAEHYLIEMEQLSHRIDSLIDSALDTDRKFTRSSNHGPDTMACINYTPGPDGTEVAEDGQQRMGAHSDYTTFTILNADPVPGLQIVGSDGQWVDVIPDPDALLVNVGDVLAMYTNDVWSSTLHRVVPMAAGSAAYRRSIAYFHYPNLEVTVAPLDRFVSDDRPARYEAVTVADHLRSKLTAPKTQEPSTGASTVAGRLEP